MAKSARSALAFKVLLLGAAALAPHMSPARAQAAAAVAEPNGSAPNVLVIMTDDVGYGASSAFGGPVPTPAFDALAQSGLKYSNFHTTALCSPTRAALLTGRDPHSVGMGTITEARSADPGYTSEIPKSAATMARVLKDNGYDTAMIGKYHIVPKAEAGPTGPFDHWPDGMGFQYFYGFEGAMTNAWAPSLIENRNTVEPPANDATYHLEKDLADHAIAWLHNQKASPGGRPFFMHYAPGAAHAPLLAPKPWIDRFKGRFDAGWDNIREETFARQKTLGLMPAGAVLSPRPQEVPPWDSLTQDQKTLYARYMEVWAANLAYADAQIGRIVDELKSTGDLDNTIIVYIQGDNGASAEGGRNGAFNYFDVLNAIPEGTGSGPGNLDRLGGARSAPAIPTGWALAMDTPFPYWKMRASDLGGMTNGMVLSWPKGIAARGETRSQFANITDIAPTIYQAARISPPTVVDGVTQMPLAGRSIAPTFASNDVPPARRQQYFETIGSMSIYKDGWFASLRLRPGETMTDDMKSDENWSLYNLKVDPTQTKDLAAENPAVVADLKASFRRDAIGSNVFPISLAHKPAVTPHFRRAGAFEYYPSDARYNDAGFPDIRRRSWRIQAKINVSKADEGVILTQGGYFAGWGLFLIKGVPTFIYKFSDGDQSTLHIAADRALTPGAHSLEVKGAYGGGGTGKGGSFTLSVDGVTAAEGRLPMSASSTFANEGASIGHDTGTPLTRDYRPPFTFTGRIEKVTIEIGPVASSLPAPSASSISKNGRRR